MVILPAIDIHNGECVRLKKGDFSTASKVAEDPYKTAASFLAAGAEWIHMVDLDGAKEDIPKNREIFQRVAKESGLKVELGGGIRTMEQIEDYLSSGISRVILGSAAVKNPELVREAVKRYGDAIAVGIDAKDRYVKTEGWLNIENVDFIDLAKAMEDAGVKTVIYTDISRDGMLSGLSGGQLFELSQAVSMNIIASGGVSSLDDVRMCRDMGLYGCIIGKSLYTGDVDLSRAVKIASGF